MKHTHATPTKIVRPRDESRQSTLASLGSITEELFDKLFPQGRLCFLADVRQCNVGLDRKCGGRMQVGARSQ
jgi:hypothetical protein